MCHRITSFASRDDLQLWSVIDLREKPSGVDRNGELLEFNKILNRRMYKSVDETTQYLSDLETAKQQLLTRLKELDSEYERMTNTLTTTNPFMSIANQTLADDDMDQD